MNRQIHPEDRLLFRVDPVPWESPRGYLCRVAYEHNYQGPLSITQIAGLQPWNLECEDALKRLSKVLRLEPEEWRRMCYRHVKGSNRRDQRLFYGKQISANDLNYNRPRLCPACLRERSVWWAIWDLGLVIACPVHRGLLLSHCPGCKRKLGWGRPAVHLCRCGIDFRELASEPADRDLVAINMAIYNAAGFTRGDVVESCVRNCGFPAEILALQLGSLLRLVLFVGSMKLHRDKRTFGATDLAGAIEIGRAGATVFKDWPGLFGEALRDMVPPTGDYPEIPKFSDVFGSFYHSLCRILPRDRFEFVHDAFEFVIEDWKGFIYPTHRFFSATVEWNSEWVSRNEAERLAGVSYELMSRMIREGQVEALCLGKRCGGRGRWVRRESLNRWIGNRDAERACYLSRDEARRELGLGYCAVLRVAAAGVIHFVKGFEWSGRTHSLFFLREDVMRVRAAFERYSVPAAAYSKPGRLIALRDAMRKFLGRDSGLAAVIRAVIDGHLAPVAYTNQVPGITGYLFLADELRRYRPVQVLAKPSEGFLNYKEAATMLGVTSAVVSGLVAQGLLPAPIPCHRGLSKLISVPDVRSFADRYVAAPVLAGLFNLSSAAFSGYLRNSEIPLVRVRADETKTGKGFNALFLSRSDVTVLQHRLVGDTSLGAQQKRE